MTSIISRISSSCTIKAYDANAVRFRSSRWMLRKMARYSDASTGGYLRWVQARHTLTPAWRVCNWKSVIFLTDLHSLQNSCAIFSFFKSPLAPSTLMNSKKRTISRSRNVTVVSSLMWHDKILFSRSINLRSYGTNVILKYDWNEQKTTDFVQAFEWLLVVVFRY